jgi:anti-sigma B factor antagonist
MELRECTEGDIVILEVEGYIIAATDASLMHDRLHEHLEAGKRRFVIDLERCEWINATGLGTLITTHTVIINKGGELRLCNISDKIKNLLTTTRLIKVFDICDSREDALQSLGNETKKRGGTAYEIQ